MMDAQSKISILKSMVTERINIVLASDAPRSLYDPMRYTVSAGGKLLRPVLLMLVHEALGGVPDQALHAAVALELTHNFTLVHDDIMDHDDLRRGRETVHKRWDESTAILAGDGLFALAFSELAQTRSPNLTKALQIFSQGILRVCEGQAMDKDFERRDEITLDEYYEMIDKKTGQLFQVACHVGALLADVEKDQISAVVQYGQMLGRAFQIQDDLLDAISQESILGKNIGSDLQEHKKSFLVVHALHSSSRSRCEQLIKKDNLTTKDIQTLVQIFEEIGTIGAARAEISRALHLSQSLLDNIRDNPNKQILLKFIDNISGRQF
jgi:geranylgeranyl pyrophosphate synthase